MTLTDFARICWQNLPQVQEYARLTELRYIFRILAEERITIREIGGTYAEVRRLLKSLGYVPTKTPAALWAEVQAEQHLFMAWILIADMDLALLHEGKGRTAIGVTSVMIGAVLDAKTP
jgi:hypothetical protein